MLQTAFDLSLIWIWHLKFDLVWFEQLFTTFENVWIWSEKFEFDFKHWKIINFISFWQLIYFPVPELTNFIFFLHENIFFKVFCSKVRQKISNIWNYLTFEFDIPKFDLIWIWHFYIGLSLKLFEFDHHEFDLIWIWEKTFEAFPICNLDFKWFNLQIPYRFLKLGGIGSYHLQATILGALNVTSYK